MKPRYCATAISWVGAAVGMRLAQDAYLGPASWCYTYLSEILVPAPTLPVSPPPAISLSPGPSYPSAESGTGGIISSPPPSSLSGTPLIPGTPGLTTTSGFGASTTVSSLPTPSVPIIQEIIFFISTPGGARKRYLETRATQGFLNNDAPGPQQRCDGAKVYTLASGQLSDTGTPIHYSPGDNYKQLRGTELLSAGAISTTFTVDGRILQFSNSSLPGGRADFCQDDAGVVYITFTSSPISCQPVILIGFEASLCQNGQIVGTNLPSAATTPVTVASSVRTTDGFPADTTPLSPTAEGQTTSAGPLTSPVSSLGSSVPASGSLVVPSENSIASSEALTTTAITSGSSLTTSTPSEDGSTVSARGVTSESSSADTFMTTSTRPRFFNSSTSISPESPAFTEPEMSSSTSGLNPSGTQTSSLSEPTPPGLETTTGSTGTISDNSATSSEAQSSAEPSTTSVFSIQSQFYSDSTSSSESTSLSVTSEAGSITSPISTSEVETSAASSVSTSEGQETTQSSISSETESTTPLSTGQETTSPSSSSLEVESSTDSSTAEQTTSFSSTLEASTTSESSTSETSTPESSTSESSSSSSLSSTAEETTSTSSYSTAEETTSTSSSSTAEETTSTSSSTTEETTSTSSSTAEETTSTSSSTAEETTSSSSSSSSSTSISPTATPTPMCEEGVEYAVYFFDENSADCNQIYQTVVDYDPLTLNLANAIQGRTPQVVGVTQTTFGFSYSPPQLFYNSAVPDDSPRCFVLEHRGYIVVSDNTEYTLQLGEDLDDLIYVWLGDTALSGQFDPSNTVIRQSYHTYFNSQFRYTFNSATFGTNYIPIRVFYSNVRDDGLFQVSVTDGSGSTPEFSTCSKDLDAPFWLPWEQERVRESSTTTSSSSTSTSSSSSSTSSTPSATPTPICTPGLEFGVYYYPMTGNECKQLLSNWQSKDPNSLNLALMIQSKVPQGTGRTQLTAWTDYTPQGVPYNGGGKPISIFGYTTPSNTDPFNTCYSVQERGFLEFPGAGTYTFNIINEQDDNLYVWLGDDAVSGTFYPGNSQLRKLFESDNNKVTTYSITVSDTEKYLPIRIYYANRLGPGYFNLAISGPTGLQPSLVQCSGTDVAPDYLPWEDERVGGP